MNNKLLLNLLLLSLLIVGCAKEEEESAGLSGASASGSGSCMVSNPSTCITGQFVTSTLCTQTYEGTFSSETCTTTGSKGSCSVTSDGLTFVFRYYYDDLSVEQAACTNSGGTFTADSAKFIGTMSQGKIFCEYQDKCISLEKVSVENAENFCNQLNGYLVDSCK